MKILGSNRMTKTLKKEKKSKCVFECPCVHVGLPRVSSAALIAFELIWLIMLLLSGAITLTCFLKVVVLLLIVMAHAASDRVAQLAHEA